MNATASVTDTRVTGQTPIFHAVTQFEDLGAAVTQLLLHRGADPTVRAKLPGDYERLDEFVECTPLEYALLFGRDSRRKTVEILRGYSGDAPKSV